MVFVFGYPAGESEEPIFSGRVAGTVSDTLQFPIREIRDNEIRQTIPSSALFLRQPSNIKDTIIYDPLTKRYVVASLIGGKYYYNRPFMETLQDLLKARSKMSLYEYNRRQIQEGNKYDFKSLVSDIQFLDKILSPIFGINKIRIEVQGSAELTLGVKTNKVDNPTLPIDMRKTTSLDFDEKIQFNIGGNIGDLVNLDWSYNTEATFDYDNILKLNYEGKEDDIVKKVEAGNVSLPLTGTLISGGQNLWGFRTDLQFGKLSMSSIFSQQKGESKVIQLEKGAEKQDFEVSALRYEANKHFFLSRFFRDQYDAALQNLPVVNSGVVITKIEVWVTGISLHLRVWLKIMSGIRPIRCSMPVCFPPFPGRYIPIIRAIGCIRPWWIAMQESGISIRFPVFYPRSVPVSIPARIMKNWKMPVCWILPNIS